MGFEHKLSDFKNLADQDPMSKANIRIAKPLEKPKTPNINKRNPHFVNNTTQKTTNIKTIAPNNIVIQKTAPNNDRTTDSRRR